MLISLLRKYTNGKDLIRPAATRFATAYLTLSCLNEHRAPLVNLFNSQDWKDSKFSSTKDGKEVAKSVMDNNLWKNIVTCLKGVAPLIKVLRLVDSEEKLAMGFIYEAMESAKEKIKQNFNSVKKSYELIWNIIDERWEAQLHKPLHAAAYYLNPHFHYDTNFKPHYMIKQGLYDCLSRMVGDQDELNKIEFQLNDFHNARDMFGRETAQALRKKLPPAEWWDSYGDGCPELQRIAIRILSLCCSSSGCERNWSAFEMIHTKKRNRLHQKKMNDLAFVMCNLKLTRKQKSRAFNYDFDDICSDDEWITEGRTSGDNVEEEDDEVFQPYEITENMANPLSSVDLNVDFNIDDVRTNYNDNDEVGDANGDYNGEGEEFEDNGDDDNPTFEDLC